MARDTHKDRQQISGHPFASTGPDDPVSPAVARRGIQDRIADLERDARFVARKALPEANGALADVDERLRSFIVQTEKAIIELAATQTASHTRHDEAIRQLLDAALTRNAELEGHLHRLKEHSLLVEKLHRERIGQCNTTQAALDKFQSACGDQAIQIMELRGDVKRKDEEHEAEVSSLRQSLWAAQNERDQAKGAIAVAVSGSDADELRTRLADAQRANEELSAELAKANKAAEDLAEERRVIDMAHSRGIAAYKALHDGFPGGLPPVRADLVTSLLLRITQLEQDREGQAEALAVADGDRVPLRMDLDEAIAKLRRVQPVLDLLPEWSFRAFGTGVPNGALLSYEIPLYRAWKDLEASEAKATTGIALDGSTD